MTTKIPVTAPIKYVVKTAFSYQVAIYIAGDLETARQSLRRQCFEEGLCVTLDSTEFIYTAGLETGMRIGFVNYPRFPKEPSEIRERVERVATELLNDLHQWSALIETPETTYWLTRRPEDLKGDSE